MTSPHRMRQGLESVRDARATTVGTMTIDSYTRVCDFDSAETAVRLGEELNGYPIATHPPSTTQWVLSGLHAPDFPVQVRHGSPHPQHIVRAMAQCNLSATEGGPVSYTLPYGRFPLAAAVEAWRETCSLLGQLTSDPHVETFGGCMLGQLCPPSLLVALSVLEAKFLAQQGIRSVSVSYAQQFNPDQDTEAVWALRDLCDEMLDVGWHVVIYTYMGVYPSSRSAALSVLEESVDLAVKTGSERLIVKTTSESHRIPTITENVAALEHASGYASHLLPSPRTASPDSQTYREASALIAAVLDGHDDVGSALIFAFRRGLLDVPYCLHPDNAGAARSSVTGDGRIVWAELGRLPLAHLVTPRVTQPLTAAGLQRTLNTMRRRHHDDENRPTPQHDIRPDRPRALRHTAGPQ